MAEKSTSKMADATTTALPPFNEADLAKLFSDANQPGLTDIESVLSAHRRNLEALSEANRAALEGAQAVARRHMEIMQSTMTGLSERLKDFSSSDNPSARAAKKTELLKQAYENAVCNTRELGDLIQKSNSEAMQKLNHRFSEAMSEMKTLFRK